MNVGNLPAQLFSPFKLSIIGLTIVFCFGFYNKSLTECHLWTYMIVLIFLVICEILHNDHIRIRLNGRAYHKVKEKYGEDILNKL